MTCMASKLTETYGFSVGYKVGVALGNNEGRRVGFVADAVGLTEGTQDGLGVRAALGTFEGSTVGGLDGENDGLSVGKLLEGH